MTDRPRFKLHDLDIRRVDLVDRGAAQDAHIVFHKSDTPTTYEEDPVSEIPTKQDWDASFRIVGQKYVDDEIAKDLNEGIAMAWEDNFEEVYEEYRDAPSVPEPEELVEKSDPRVVLVRDHIFKSMMSRAKKLSDLDPSRSPEQMFLDLAQSPKGAPLYDMYASDPLGQRPLADARGEVRKGFGGTNLSAVLAQCDAWLRP